MPVTGLPAPIFQRFYLDPKLVGPDGVNVAGFTHRSAKDQARAQSRFGEERPDDVCYDTLSFLVDLERIAGTDAYARLGGIWQLSATGKTGSKTRETHTEDTRLVARSLCRVLQLGEISSALAEAICAAHDIGHPAFAHQGEHGIHKVLAQYGIDWDHDRAALQVLQDWPQTGDHHQGLNLTAGVLEGVAKRYWRYRTEEHVADKYLGTYIHDVKRLPTTFRDEKHAEALQLDKFNPIEGQIACTADWVSFLASDVTDGLREGLLDLTTLEEYFPGCAQRHENHKQALDAQGVPDGKTRDELLAKSVSTYMKNLLLSDILHHTQSELLKMQKTEQLAGYVKKKKRNFGKEGEDEILETSEFENFEGTGMAENIRHHGHPVVSFSPAMMKRVKAFEKDIMEAKVFPKVIEHIQAKTPDGMDPESMVVELMQDFIDRPDFPFPEDQRDWKTRRDAARAQLAQAENAHDHDHEEQVRKAKAGLGLLGAEYCTRMLADKDVLQYHCEKQKQKPARGWGEKCYAPPAHPRFTRVGTEATR